MKMSKKKHIRKGPEIYDITDEANRPFKCIFYKHRCSEEDSIFDMEEFKKTNEEEINQLQKEDLQRMKTNVLDMKGETDGTNLSEIIRLVFQEFGVQNEDDKALQIVEYKLNVLTMNDTWNGNPITI